MYFNIVFVKSSFKSIQRSLTFYYFVFLENYLLFYCFEDIYFDREWRPFWRASFPNIEMSYAKEGNISSTEDRRGGSKSDKLKENSIYVIYSNSDADDVIKAVKGAIGRSNILGCVKVVGQWVITFSNDGDAELLQGTGLLIKEDVCEVIGVGRSIVTVSFFDVPTFVNDEDLSAKLIELGCVIKSLWTRKHYAKFPHIENGIRYALKYVTIALAKDTYMRNCSDYKCKNCDLRGHRDSRCPKTQCYKCHQFGHKSFQCLGDKRQQNEDDLNYLVEHMEAENLDTEANVEETENVSQTIDNQNSEIGEQNTSTFAVQKELHTQCRRTRDI